ncbi:UDP-N-acetylmuramoyl-L-alanyl-D-glutamate--2,6-diaminopimelate ligase [Candidatus Wolfebacteria bacterium]|nr:UDP-N-acetylmuramoyl-L-alanyl-D-glutamate--2,6-diaminopimelate ligase [Candidatus Wolfebacteria bacterium]
MNRVLQSLKKIIPSALFDFFAPFYHLLLSFCGAFFYGFPSLELTVIGVTGTKGKTTTCNLIAQILESAGLKTGLMTTVNFKIGEREWINDTKQTMLGRFELQKLLREMARAGCRYAVIETSSEGILQYRHRFIDYSVAVFTNLTPEHIERHGSFENYRRAKIKPFEKAAKKENGVGVYNLDDPNINYFLKPSIKNKYGYGAKISNFSAKGGSTSGGQFLPIRKANRGSSILQSRIGIISNKFQISNIELSPEKTIFNFDGENFEMPLIGEFNVYNAAAAICVALSQNIPMEQIKKALASAKPPPGRMEIIDKGQDFTVIVDYAHEPASLEAAYKAIHNSFLRSKSPEGQFIIRNSKLICLLGAQGGGRDKWKRAEMGKIAAQYCDEIILTNEDPYDENPSTILNDIEAGFSSISNFQFLISNLYEVIDREEAIQKAIFLAQKGDVVILTGKGGEVWMCVEGGKKIPWDEKKIVEEILSAKRYEI